jgi:hypothetical protein
MKLVRIISSGKFGLLLLALLSGTYLSLTFGNEDPWFGMVELMKSSFLMQCSMVLFSLHFICKSIYSVMNIKMKRIGSGLLFISLSLIILGILFSVIFRDMEKHRVNVNDNIDKGLKLVSLDLDMPGEVLIVGEENSFTLNKADAVIDDRGKQLHLKAFPFIRTSSGYGYINDAGLSPNIDVTISGQSISMKRLDLLPPNKSMSVPIVTDHSMEIGFAADREIKKGRLTALHYNLQSPGYRIVIKRSDEVLLDEVMQDNMTKEGNNILVKIGATEKWVEIVFVNSRAVLILYMGVIGLFIGMVLYPVEIYYRLRA